MMKAVFLLPRIDPVRFTGGVWCVYQRALALREAGWEVELVPAYPSPIPSWMDLSGLVFRTGGRTTGRELTKSCVRVASTGLRFALRTASKNDLRNALRRLAGGWMLRSHVPLTDPMLAAAMFEHLKDVPLDGDVVFATSYETAELVHLLGRGRRIYLCQHFEPLFAQERDAPAWAHLRAEQSYRLDLDLLANSSWLRGVLREFCGREVWLAPNGIDSSRFHPAPSPRRGDEFTVVSYGGRDARWKGFREMAEGMALFRRNCPKRVRWLVYGGAILPPDNDLCPYEDRGFLDHGGLNRLYNEADCMLSASHRESYPLFPLEAMSCGLPVIAGKSGTEDYARDGENCLWVDPISPEGIAQRLQQIADSPELASRLSQAGLRTAAGQDWRHSNAGFLRTLDRILATPPAVGA